jgi:hypothetical protein
MVCTSTVIPNEPDFYHHSINQKLVQWKYADDRRWTQPDPKDPGLEP